MTSSRSEPSGTPDRLVKVLYTQDDFRKENFTKRYATYVHFHDVGCLNLFDN